MASNDLAQSAQEAVMGRAAAIKRGPIFVHKLWSGQILAFKTDLRRMMQGW